MTREEAKSCKGTIELLQRLAYNIHGVMDVIDADNCKKIIKTLEKEPRKGEWLRMSDLSEQEDDRYKCSRCGNVVHHKNEMDLYTFNSWCGRCGSDNGRHINYEVEE